MILCFQPPPTKCFYLNLSIYQIYTILGYTYIIEYKFKNDLVCFVSSSFKCS